MAIVGSLEVADRALAEARRAQGAVENSLDSLLEDLERWVNLDSPSLVVSAVDRLASELAGKLEEYGARPELVNAGDDGLYLHASLTGGGASRVALLCHHDTVFPLGTVATRGFCRRDSRAFGPGVADMKGGIAVAVHTLRYLAQGARPFGLVELVSVPDEETRNVKPATMDRLSGFDAVLTLECGRPDGSVVSARRGGRWIRLEAYGRAAHAGVEPDVGKNAILGLCREAVRIADLCRERPGITVEITRIEGGETVNTVPETASFVVDARAESVSDLAWLCTNLDGVCAADGITFRAVDLGGPPPMQRSADVATLAKTAVMIGGELGARFSEVATGGVSDACWAAELGIPTLDGLGPVGGSDHTIDEYIEIESVPTRCGVVAGLITAIELGLLRTETVG